MSDLILDILSEIGENTKIIEKRFSGIQSPDDFIANEEGIILLDSIGIRLMAIGESVNKIQKLHPAILGNYKQVEWDDVIRFRSFIAHHYELLDYQIVFSICKSYMPVLSDTISKMIQDLTNTK